MSHGPSMNWWRKAVADMEREVDRTVPRPSISAPEGLDIGKIVIEALTVPSKQRSKRIGQEEPPKRAGAGR